ncbi:MAG: cysteine peptidase family C39 domain-containing protein [Candidatus Xenobiia bacterium LiM19]
MSEINPVSRVVDLSAFKTLEQMQMKPSADGAPPVTISDTFQSSKGGSQAATAPPPASTALPSASTDTAASAPAIQQEEQNGPNTPAIIDTPPADLLPVPDTRQSVDYSCGASAFQAVLMYYGEEYMESSLMNMLGTTTNGTNPKDIVRVANDLGYNAELKENLTIEDLEASVKKGVPVIVDGQAWRDGEDLDKPWGNVWESGHYMVVIGTDKKNVYLEDPSLLGSKGVIPREEFVERWHDYDDKKYYQMGIFITGKKASPPPPFAQILSAQINFPL